MNAFFVYRCFDASGRLVYVGQSRDAMARLQHHQRNAFWAHMVERVTIKVFGSREDALAVEREAIRTERPRFNNMGRWATRVWWDASDYEDFAQALAAGSGWYTRRTTYDRLFAEYRMRFGYEHPMAAEIRERLSQHAADRDARLARDHARWAQERRAAGVES